MPAGWDLFLYFCVVLWTLIKMEQATEKSPNFQQILLNTRRSFSQNFNDVASFVLELLGFIFYVYTIFYALLRNFIKTKQAIEKAPHFEEVITNT